jgi:serine O-acetyltransferase
MFDNLRADFAAAGGDRTMEKGWFSILTRFETPAVVCYRFSHWTLKVRIPVVRQLLILTAVIWQRVNQMLLGIFISPDAEIGPGFVIHTPFGINVGPSKIGSNCTVSTGTLIGSGCRSVGDNVYFGAGCKIVGDLKIGSNVVIVANSVVLTDVPDNITIMGVPARIRIPGGRPKRFAWRTIDGQASDGKATEGQQTAGKPNGKAAANPANGKTAVENLSGKAAGENANGKASTAAVKNEASSGQNTHA